MYAWTCIYAVTAAAVQSMTPAALAGLTENLQLVGVRVGMVFTIVSFAVLTGPPIGGAIISRQKGEYWGAQTFAGGSLLLGSSLLAVSRAMKLRQKGGGLWSRV